MFLRRFRHWPLPKWKVAKVESDVAEILAKRGMQDNYEVAKAMARLRLGPFYFPPDEPLTPEEIEAQKAEWETARNAFVVTVVLVAALPFALGDPTWLLGILPCAPIFYLLVRFMLRQ